MLAVDLGFRREKSADDGTATNEPESLTSSTALCSGVVHHITGHHKANAVRLAFVSITISIGKRSGNYCVTGWMSNLGELANLPRTNMRLAVRVSLNVVRREWNLSFINDRLYQM